VPRAIRQKARSRATLLLACFPASLEAGKQEGCFAIDGPASLAELSPCLKARSKAYLAKQPVGLLR